MASVSDDLAAARKRLGRIRAEQARLALAAPELGAKVRTLMEEAKAAKTNALIEATADARAQAAKAQDALDAAVARRDEGDEAERLLAAEARTVAAEIARIEGTSERARQEAVKAALRTRIEEGMPAFRELIVNVIALERLTDPQRIPVERLADFLFRKAGTSPMELLHAGADRAFELRAGREVR
jgi:tryptophan 2,3-dioxygenase